jgi:hypothetical protein
MDNGRELFPRHIGCDVILDPNPMHWGVPHLESPGLFGFKKESKAYQVVALDAAGSDDFDHNDWCENTVIMVPYWFVFALVLAPMLLTSVRSFRRRHRKGHCVKCNYDLRASTDRCPECGQPIPPKNSAKSPETNS